MNYGPLDFDHPLAPKVIKLGIVGTSEAIEGVIRWVEKIRLGIDAKPSKRPNLFPRFPGFGDGHILQTDFLTDSQLMRPIPPKAFEMLCAKPKTNEVIKEIASLFLEELEYLVQKTSASTWFRKPQQIFWCVHSPRYWLTSLTNKMSLNSIKRMILVVKQNQWTTLIAQAMSFTTI